MIFLDDFGVSNGFEIKVMASLLVALYIAHKGMTQILLVSRKH